jgi:hypothetical protein
MTTTFHSNGTLSSVPQMPPSTTPGQVGKKRGGQFKELNPLSPNNKAFELVNDIED